MIWGFYSQAFPLSLLKQSVDGQPCDCPSSVLSAHHHHRQDYAEYGHDKNDRKHRYDKSPVHVSTLQSDLQVVSDCDNAAEGADYDADGNEYHQHHRPKLRKRNYLDEGYSQIARHSAFKRRIKSPLSE